MKIECGCHCIKCKSTDLESNRIGEVENRIPVSDNIDLTIKGVPDILHRGDFLEIYGTGDPGSAIPAVGASGAISGILGAYLVIFPRARILTLMGYFFIHVQARWFLPFWLIFQNLLPFFIGGFGAAGGGVAFLAHIGGFVVGLATGYLYKKTHSSDFTYGTRYGYRPDY